MKINFRSNYGYSPKLNKELTPELKKRNITVIDKTHRQGYILETDIEFNNKKITFYVVIYQNELIIQYDDYMDILEATGIFDRDDDLTDLRVEEKIVLEEFEAILDKYNVHLDTNKQIWFITSIETFFDDFNRLKECLSESIKLVNDKY